MKKLLLGLLVLSSFSTFANTANTIPGQMINESLDFIEATYVLNCRNVFSSGLDSVVIVQNEFAKKTRKLLNGDSIAKSLFTCRNSDGEIELKVKTKILLKNADKAVKLLEFKIIR
jgi:hypothetical protein